MADDGRPVSKPNVNAYIIGPEDINKADLVPVDKTERSGTDDPTDSGYADALRTELVEPPYDPNAMCRLYEHANSLRPSIDAYKTNIDGFGHVFEPIIQLREAGARELISDAIYLERDQQYAAGKITPLARDMPPTDEDITKKIDEVKYAMRLEKARVDSFFEYCVAEESFVSLRRKTREDLEATGNGYWEVIRNAGGKIAQFAYMPSRSIRVAKTKSDMLEIDQQVRIGTLSFQTERFRRKFRRYVQLGGDKFVHFKEFGDPTCVSTSTGKSYKSLEDMQTVEGETAQVANEVFHFKIHAIRNGSYGVPRWIGNLLSVMGSRSAEEVNLAYFNNKSIPPMAILVSGGKLGPDTVKRLQDFVEVHIKGQKNFHKILVIEAETTLGAVGLQDNSNNMRIELKMLTDAQLKDGLFLEYDAANMDKVGMGFRLPRLLRGDIRDFNRASAEAALEYAEAQVFGPERNDFDFMMNRFVLTELGIRHWTFKSLGPRLTDSKGWKDAVVELMHAGVLTPADGREIASKKILQMELPLIDADWVNQPLPLTIAGVRADNDMDGVIPMGIEPSANPANMKPDLTPAPGLLAAAKARVLGEAKRLIKLRDRFRALEEAEAVSKYKEDRAKNRPEDDTVVFKMTLDEIETKFGVVPK